MVSTTNHEDETMSPNQTDDDGCFRLKFDSRRFGLKVVAVTRSAAGFVPWMIIATLCVLFAVMVVAPSALDLVTVKCLS